MGNRFAFVVGRLMTCLAFFVALFVVLSTPRGGQIPVSAWIYTESSIAVITVLIGTPAFLVDWAECRSERRPVHWDVISYLLLPLPLAVLAIHLLAFILGRSAMA